MKNTDAETMLEPQVLATPIRGLNLSAASLGDELGPRPTALVFLRHFG